VIGDGDFIHCFTESMIFLWILADQLPILLKIDVSSRMNKPSLRSLFTGTSSILSIADFSHK